MNVAIYDRFTTDNHAERAAIAADRLTNMRMWCQQNGHHILNEYIEQANKHVGDVRPAFQRLQDDVFSGNHTIEAIVVLDYSRLFRDSVKGALFERKLRAHTVKLISMANDQAMTTNNLTDDMIRKLFVFFDEWQSSEHRKHTLRAIKQNVRQGYFSGGIAPFGYKAQNESHPAFKDRKRLALFNAEADVVRLIFDLRNHGSAGSAFTPKQIAGYLNKEKLLRRERRWTPAAICKVLHDRIYIGEHIYNKSSRHSGTLKPESEWITTKVPAIVTPETFTKAANPKHQKGL